MELWGYSYGEWALGLSIAAGVIGLVYSVIVFAVKRKRDEAVTWQPLPSFLGFALFWPALVCLSPYLIFDNIVDKATQAEKPWAVRLSNELWYQSLGRVVLGIGFGIMCCYVWGFFV